MRSGSAGARSAMAPVNGATNGTLALVASGSAAMLVGVPDVAKQGKDVVIDQFARVFCAAVGLIAVVHLHNFYIASAHATLGIELVKEQFGTGVELDAQLSRRACKGSRLSEHDAIRLGVHCRKTDHAGSTSGERKLATIDHGHIVVRFTGFAKGKVLQKLEVGDVLRAPCMG